MKKAFVLLAIVGILFFGCKTDEDDAGPAVLRAVSFDNKAIALEPTDSAKYARGLEEGGAYVLTYTMANGVDGNTTKFAKPVAIIVTVQKINNNQITFKPSDSAIPNFTATVNANGQLIRIEDLQGVTGGVLFPYEYNQSGIQGAWFGWSSKTNKDGVEEIKTNSFVFDGENLALLHNNVTKGTPEQPQRAKVNVTGNIIKISNLEGWNFDIDDFDPKLNEWSGGDTFTFEMLDDDTLYIVGDDYYTRVKDFN